MVKCRMTLQGGFMGRNFVDVMCAIAIFVIVIFLCYMGEEAKSDAGFHHGPGLIEAFRTTGICGYLQLFCAALGAVKLVRLIVVTGESNLASPALLSGIRKQLDGGQVDRALSQAKSDSGYAGRVLAAALGRKSVGGDVRGSFEDAAALEYSRLRGRADTLLGIAIVGFLAGPFGVVTGQWAHLQVLLTKRSPDFADVTGDAFESMALLLYGFIIALVFVPAFLLMKGRVSTKVSKVNVELGALLDRAAPQKPMAY